MSATWEISPSQILRVELAELVDLDVRHRGEVLPLLLHKHVLRRLLARQKVILVVHIRRRKSESINYNST